MILPWKRQAASAQERLAEAEKRRLGAHQLAGQARATTARLTTEIRRNGWTELFTIAMGSR